MPVPVAAKKSKCYDSGIKRSPWVVLL